jgi:methyltransferase (TIGR00027 family)
MLRTHGVPSKLGRLRGDRSSVTLRTTITIQLTTMKADKASKTAQYMALFRAIETARPSKDRLFFDPYAIGFLDRGLKFTTKLSSFPLLGRIVKGYIQNKIPGAHSSALGRTKFIDDQLKQSISNGVRQVIILGAGFDTRGLRLDYMQSIPLIEIDHPNTSRYKLSVLKDMFGIDVNAKNDLNPEINPTRYCQIDFNTQSLEDLAEKHSINYSIPTTIIWEGVTNYLSAEAVESTFSWISRFAAGSHVIFTYVNQEVLDHPENYFGGVKLLDDLRKIEENWTFGLKPEDVSMFLSKFSLKLLNDLGANDYRNKYLPERAERGYEFYRVAVAKSEKLARP